VRRSSNNASIAWLTVVSYSSVCNRLSGVVVSASRAYMDCDSSMACMSRSNYTGLRSRETMAFLAMLMAMRYSHV
jgi:hypothetical protein